MRLFFCVLFSWVVGCVCLSPALAQDELTPVKSDITSRVLLRDRLRKENEALRQQYQDTLSKIMKYTIAAQKSAQQQQTQERSVQDLTRVKSFGEKSLQEIDSDLMVRKAQVIKLRAVLMDLESKEHLWKLKASDVEYQRQALTLDVALKQSLYEQASGDYLAKIEQLNQAILRNRLEEKDLLMQYSHVADESEILVQQQELFHKENVYLQGQQIKYQDIKRQAEDAGQKSKLDQDAFDKALQQKQAQRDDLQKRLQALDQQRQSLDEQLNQSLQKLDERAQLVEDIKRLKSENERLQSALGGLQSETNTLP